MGEVDYAGSRMMFAREVRLSTGNKFAALAVGAVLIAVVAVFLAFGFLLVVGLTVVGLLLGVGAALYRRLTGQAQAPRREVLSHHGLDPAMEVNAPTAPGDRQHRVAGEKRPH